MSHSNEGCPKCGGHVEQSYGLGGGPGFGAWQYCTSCDWHQKFQDPEGLTVEQASDEDRRIRLYNARIDRGCDRSRGLALPDARYEERHGLDAGAMASDEVLVGGCGTVPLCGDGAKP